ncbi:MAG: hypothetical protein ACR2QR_10090 [Woeseiaceae bacterium]
MSNKNNDLLDRRSVLSGMGIAAAAVAGSATTAHAATSGFEPQRHAEDAWMDELEGGHRVFLDSSSPDGGAVAMLYANNILNAHTKAYAGAQESDYAMIVCLRHYSTVFGFGDEAWEKYGEGFHNLVGFADPSTGRAPQVNLLQVNGLRSLPNRGNTIESLGARGVKFAICDNAANVFSMGLSRAGFGEAQDIYADLIASAVPNGRFVSAGVVAATRAQEYSYSLLYAG